MFIHLGGNTLVASKDVIAIIDMKMAKGDEYIRVSSDSRR